MMKDKKFNDAIELSKISGTLQILGHEHAKTLDVVYDNFGKELYHAAATNFAEARCADAVAKLEARLAPECKNPVTRMNAFPLLIQTQEKDGGIRLDTLKKAVGEIMTMINEAVATSQAQITYIGSHLAVSFLTTEGKVEDAKALMTNPR
jgi:hypothetical protein